MQEPSDAIQWMVRIDRMQRAADRDRAEERRAAGL